MGREFHVYAFNPGFPHVGINAMRDAGKDPVMDPAIEPEEPIENEAKDSAVSLRASAWLWRPWYAKLWWTAIPIYWLGMAASLKVALLADFYTSAWAGILNVLFFPLIALMVLGVGFVREWMGPIEWNAEVDGDLWPGSPRYEPRSVGGLRDPYSDPLDPRSGALHLRHIEGVD